jgi:hypothetical protein
MAQLYYTTSDSGLCQFLKINAAAARPLAAKTQRSHSQSVLGRFRFSQTVAFISAKTRRLNGRKTAAG